MVLFFGCSSSPSLPEKKLQHKTFHLCRVGVGRPNERESSTPGRQRQEASGGDVAPSDGGWGGFLGVCLVLWPGVWTRSNIDTEYRGIVKRKAKTLGPDRARECTAEDRTATYKRGNSVSEALQLICALVTVERTFRPDHCWTSSVLRSTLSEAMFARDNARAKKGVWQDSSPDPWA